MVAIPAVVVAVLTGAAVTGSGIADLGLCGDASHCRFDSSTNEGMLADLFLVARTKLPLIVNRTLDGFITSTSSFTNLVDRITLIMEPQYLPFLPVRDLLGILAAFQFYPMPSPVRIVLLA